MFASGRGKPGTQFPIPPGAGPRALQLPPSGRFRGDNRRDERATRSGCNRTGRECNPSSPRPRSCDSGSPATQKEPSSFLWRKAGPPVLRRRGVGHKVTAAPAAVTSCLESAPKPLASPFCDPLDRYSLSFPVDRAKNPPSAQSIQQHKHKNNNQKTPPGIITAGIPGKHRVPKSGQPSPDCTTRSGTLLNTALFSTRHYSQHGTILNTALFSTRHYSQHGTILNNVDADPRSRQSLCGNQASGHDDSGGSEDGRDGPLACS